MIDLFAVPTQEEIETHVRMQGDHFQGNPHHLVFLMRLLQTRRSSDDRRDALEAWSAFNTRRDDSLPGPHGMAMKGPYRESYRGLKLRGLTLESSIVGPIDLRGADLRNASLRESVLTKADFLGADLTDADLRGSWLRGARLADATLVGSRMSKAFLGDANLRGVECDARTDLCDADLQGANLSGAKFLGSKLCRANLQLCQMIETRLEGADLTGCQVFGAAAWSVKVDEKTCQDDLLVTPMQPNRGVGRGRRQSVVELTEPVPPLRTESLEHAHLVHLMTNPDLSDLLASVTSKGVLLLGRFAGEHGEVLDALRVEIRRLGYLPMKFDFEKPKDRTLKETVLTLAGLCRFIIADITEASSIPLELTTIVKDYKIPIVPIQRGGRPTFSMFQSIEREFSDRLLPSLTYANKDELIQVLERAIVEPALELAKVLDGDKAAIVEVRYASDYAGS